MNQTLKQSWQSVWIHALVWVFVIFSIYPILQIIGISLRPGDQLYSTSLSLIPDNWTAEAYKIIIFEKPFPLWLRNSLLVSLSTALIGVSLASLGGYALSRFKFLGRGVALQGIMMTQMFPATMLLLPLYVLMRKFHLVDTLAGVVVAYVATALPFCIWTMKGYYDTIPVDLEEAALIDGAGRLTAFYKITLPLSAPALVITALFSFMTGWSEFIVARVMLPSSELATLPLGLESLASTYQTEWANYAAGSVLVCIPVVVLFLLLSKFLVSGLTLGGVKG
ncbi:sugar ABC transporter permease [bacterium]|jgi:arabinogalactan oligomer/maltooligosaccharide transport system permease protein|nr:sugar ABC transporter permease [bacterium]MBT4291566.1 sugar ABC transporter permease [bacterium]MBT7310221.1 sugar ABC transporter permease [bacterium]